MPKVLILLLLITSIFTSSCLDLNTIHFPGDLLQTRCKDDAVKIENEQGLNNMQPNGKYCLTTDLEIQTWEMKTVQGDLWTFKGEFNGDNKRITIDTIDGNSFIQQIGTGGTFKNVTININKIEQKKDGSIAVLTIINNGTIKNVTIEGNKKQVIGSPKTDSSIGGLVAENHGTIEDVRISNIKIDVRLSNIKITGKLDTGGLVGYNTGSIENVTLNNVTVSGGGDNINIGGLVGFNDGNNARIDDVKLTNITVSGGGDNFNIGGLVGANSEGTINDAKVSETTITATGTPNVGGLVGYNNNSGKFITNSHANTTIKYPGGDDINAGGFIGSQENGTITKCSSAGKLTRVDTKTTTRGNDPPNLGGFIGKYKGKSIIEKSFSTTDITLNTNSGISAGGFVGYQDGGTIENCYSAGTLTVQKKPPANTTYLGGFIGRQQTSGDIEYVYTRSNIIDKNNLDRASAGLFGGQKNGNISNSYYINLNSNITKAWGGTGVANSGLTEVVVANGKPTSNWANLEKSAWTIKKGEWPKLKWEKD